MWVYFILIGVLAVVVSYYMVSITCVKDTLLSKCDVIRNSCFNPPVESQVMPKRIYDGINSPRILIKNNNITERRPKKMTNEDLGIKLNVELNILVQNDVISNKNEKDDK